MSTDIRERVAEVLSEHSRYVECALSENECGCGKTVGPKSGWNLHKADALLEAFPQLAETVEYEWAVVDTGSRLTYPGRFGSFKEVEAYATSLGFPVKIVQRRRAGEWEVVK